MSIAERVKKLEEKIKKMGKGIYPTTENELEFLKFHLFEFENSMYLLKNVLDKLTTLGVIKEDTLLEAYRLAMVDKTERIYNKRQDRISYLKQVKALEVIIKNEEKELAESKKDCESCTIPQSFKKYYVKYEKAREDIRNQYHNDPLLEHLLWEDGHFVGEDGLGILVDN
jgi:hypothetical protein